MRTLVLGLGNLLNSDDGVGVHAIERLRTDPRVPAETVLLDGGIQGVGLIPHISGFRRLLVIDAIDVGREPGTLLRLEGSAMRGHRGVPSVHQLGLADLIATLELLGEKPEEVVVLGIQPLSTEWGDGLTGPVRDSLDELVTLSIEQLRAWG